MPLYEFTCTHCAEHFEQILSFSMTEAPACPHCQSTATRRLMSMPAIHFKGSGFYKTDSANGKDEGKAEEKADTDVKADAKDADTQGGKADAKGDAGDSGPQETATPPKTAKTAGKTRQGKAKAAAG